jgi:NAD(P)-dependent dehydrogenase (short-subunit alcohol dehydrogenase family)
VDEFAGKVAVVTGAGSGMGKAFAARWAAEGMRIVAADIQTEALEATVRELAAAGHAVIGVRTDVSKAQEIQALADTALAEYGAVHLVCNNAGVEGYLEGPIWEATDRDWAWTTNVNFFSVAHGIRVFVPIMLRQGEPAHICNTASMTSVITAPNMYGITKHAVLALSEVLATNLREVGAPIGVTALCPGTIATNLFHGERNRPAELRNEVPASGAAQARELRERMHAVLAAGMAPAEVADKLVAAVRANALYLLTDHDWDDQIIARHHALLAATVD